MTYKAKIDNIIKEYQLVSGKFKRNETRPMELKYINGYEDALHFATTVLTGESVINLK